jgi:hypothetical protein
MTRLAICPKSEFTKFQETNAVRDTNMNPDQLTEKAVACLTSMLAEQGPSILSTLRDSQGGKHSFRASFKLTTTKEKVYLKAALTHSTKSDAEADGSFEIDDPTAPKLPGIGGGK